MQEFMTRNGFFVRCVQGLLVLLFVVLLPPKSAGQVENVPVSNQVYEFLDRMGVRGIIPGFSTVMIPISREEVAGLLKKIDAMKDALSSAEKEYLQRFEREFAHELDPANERASVLLHDGFGGFFSDDEKYLYSYTDSTVTTRVEFLGVFEHRRISGDSRGTTNASFDQYGGRIRGTIADHVGYFLQSMNGTFYGDKDFALSDPKFRGNVKFNNLNSPYFDYTEAALRTRWGPFGIEFGREYTLIGTGYSDRLLLSDNAPVTDFLKLDFRYKSVKFVFMNASLVQDSAQTAGLLTEAPAGSGKYLALHRIQFSPVEEWNIGVSEMIIYQRFSPDFAYLNPVNFYKSAEHSLRDRDNAFLNFDMEMFPLGGWKLYGTWLIDDIDFSKIGTGWWGNEFAWQGGVATAGVAGIPDLDATIEYTRIEPFVYSNRVAGNDYTNDNIGIGHHLQPNSDEWYLRLAYRPTGKLRTWAAFIRSRHGENVMSGGVLERNVGGDILVGHRDSDPETATFLDGNVVTSSVLQFRAAYEAFRGFTLAGQYEHRRMSDGTPAGDNYFAFRAQLEY